MRSLKVSSERKQTLQKLQRKLGYRFHNESLLNQSLVHRSYANENSSLEIYDNERLEFLGDAVLGMIVSHFLFNEYRDFSEGELSKYRSKIVREGSLAEVSRNISLGDYLLLGKGETANGGPDRPSILADSLEALLGAMYLDGGFTPVQRFVMQVFFNEGPFEKRPEELKDHKTALQESAQKKMGLSPEYHLLRSWGPDHDKQFEVEVRLKNKVIGKGQGRTKKEAEQKAAYEGIKRF